MRKTIEALFRELQVHPVLMEIGPMERPPVLWENVAPYSTYVGVGPDSKHLPPRFRDSYHQFFLQDEVITTTPDSEVVMYVTNDPVYSTLLTPRAPGTEFLDWECALRSETRVGATTINRVMHRFGLSTLDWLNTNINGMDYGVFLSIDDRVRKRVLAVDTVLHVVNFWVEGGSPLDACNEFFRQGFWLSSLFPYGFVRMKPDSLQKITNGIDLARIIEDRHVKAPNWMFMRFFRSVESLIAGGFSPRDYVVMWSFALLDRQFGFAADVAFAYEQVFGPDKYSRAMLQEAVAAIQALKPKKSALRSVVRALLPRPIRKGLRTIISAAG